MKSVIYVRVSSLEQVSGYSIEAQIEICRIWASENGYIVVRIYVEPGKSARTDDRPMFQRMIKNVLAGEAEAVIVHKVDRFARSLLDLLRYKKRLQDQGIELLSVTEAFLNGDTAENDLAVKILGAVAEYISRNIGAEAQKGQDAKARAGQWPGSIVPIGYRRIGTGRESAIQICPKQGPMITQSFKEFSAGDYTLRQWAAEARERGYLSRTGKMIRSSAWHNIFTSKFYLGQFDWQGKTYNGDHPALIDAETWQVVQDLLAGRNSGGKIASHFWLLSGLLWSEVHSRPMSGSLAKGEYRYYRALGRPGLDRHEHNVRADELENQVIDLLATIRADGSALAAPDDLRLALLSADNMAMVYPHFPSVKGKREFLRLIFLKHGLHVNAAGRVSVVGLRPGFEVIGDNLGGE